MLKGEMHMSNSYMEGSWSWVEGTHNARLKLLDTLTDDDLKFNPGGKNMSLGALWREMGEVQHAYLQSLKEFKQDFKYRNPEPGIDASTAKLKAWYQKMDEEMKAALSAMSEDDLKKVIEREGFSVPVTVQMDIYLQALLIFAGKASIFLRAMNKSLGDMEAWIG
jgi:uncharacterized damage-inducible protein DinB